MMGTIGNSMCVGLICIPEGAHVLQPFRLLAQGLFSLSKILYAALQPWKTLLSTTIGLSLMTEHVDKTLVKKKTRVQWSTWNMK